MKNNNIKTSVECWSATQQRLIRQDWCWVFTIEASLSPAATPSPSEVSISCELPPSTLWPGRHTCSRMRFSYHTSDNTHMSAVVCAIDTFSNGIGVGNLCNLSSSSKDDCLSFSAPRDAKSKGWRCAWGLVTFWRRPIKGSDEYMSIINPLKDRDSVSGSTRHFLALPALCHAMDSCVQWRS